MHHTHQGVDGIDTDIPTAWEARIVRGPVMKFLWLACQGLAYGLRPLFMMPLPPSRWVVANAVVQIAFDVLIYELWGLSALLYLPVSTLLVMGLHPISGHYLSEHYVIRPGQETYSYYGPLNLLAFNVGYHNEHHDFPYIAGSRLPKLRRLAPEFYDSLAHHTSWTRILWDYVTRPDLGATSRIKRARLDVPTPEASAREASL
jgi:sphingolipid delta-4 desaturase